MPSIFVAACDMIIITIHYIYILKFLIFILNFIYLFICFVFCFLFSFNLCYHLAFALFYLDTPKRLWQKKIRAHFRMPKPPPPLQLTSTTSSTIASPPPPPPPPPSSSSSSPSLMIDMSVKHFMCKQCGVKFKFLKALQHHQQSCSIEAKCPFCPIVVRDRKELVKHVETHRPGYNRS